MNTFSTVHAPDYVRLGSKNVGLDVNDELEYSKFCKYLLIDKDAKTVNLLLTSRMFIDLSYYL